MNITKTSAIFFLGITLSTAVYCEESADLVAWPTGKVLTGPSVDGVHNAKDEMGAATDDYVYGGVGLMEHNSAKCYKRVKALECIYYDLAAMKIIALPNSQKLDYFTLEKFTLRANELGIGKSKEDIAEMTDKIEKAGKFINFLFPFVKPPVYDPDAPGGIRQP